LFKCLRLAGRADRPPAVIEEAFCKAAWGRGDYTAIDRAELDRCVRDAFRQGMAEARLDWYHLARGQWPGR
jgi:hypothetical protein